MKTVECEFESEVLSAVVQSRWPQRVDTGLRAHVAACPICADVVSIAGVIDGAREEMRPLAVVPDSGRVWWLAQMRARREAAAAAGRPITAAQVIAFACAMGLLGACFGATSTWFQSALASIQALLPSSAALIAGHGVLVLAAAALVVLIPTAIYLTMLRD
jgi:hypothetical protein